MKLSEEQIKDILQRTQLKIEADSQMEEAIINEINRMKQYDQLIQQSRQNARISLWVSLILTFGLVVSLLYKLLSTSPQEAFRMQSLLPALMVIIVLMILHQFVYFGTDMRQRTSTNS